MRSARISTAGKMNEETNYSGKKELSARWRAVLVATLLLATGAAAQVPGKAPTLSIAPVPLTTAQRAQATMVNLNFRVPPGYHINSNTPKSEFLIPTALKMDLPTDIILGKIEYPAGEDASFPFSPDEKLSVYSGDFTIAVAVHPLHSVVPGKYVMHGVLRYQACDNAACYPPKTVPVSFEVKVVKEPPQHRANPAQSPHIHN
ncbi:MAG: protein-disulfide reductase DsbD domain-containing protein [Candidatus Sulfotelmatobacter sp.]